MTVPGLPKFFRVFSACFPDIGCMDQYIAIEGCTSGLREEGVNIFFADVGFRIPALALDCMEISGIVRADQIGPQIRCMKIVFLGPAGVFLNFLEFVVVFGLSTRNFRIRSSKNFPCRVLVLDVPGCDPESAENCS